MIALAYHRIARDPGDPQAVRPDAFVAQVGWLANRGYRCLSLAAAMRAPTPRTIALTFDDGTEDFASTAWPVLRAAGFGATLFVVPGKTGSRADWAGAAGVSLLGWPALRALAGEGVEIGAHGRTHAHLAEMRPEAAQAEIVAAREMLALQLGTPPPSFAYPYGEWSPTLEHAVERAGFEYACTARSGHNRANTPRLKLRRTLVRGEDSIDRFSLKVLTGYASATDLRMDVQGMA